MLKWRIPEPLTEPQSFYHQPPGPVEGRWSFPRTARLGPAASELAPRHSCSTRWTPLKCTHTYTHAHMHSEEWCVHAEMLMWFSPCYSVFTWAKWLIMSMVMYLWHDSHRDRLAFSSPLPHLHRFLPEPSSSGSYWLPERQTCSLYTVHTNTHTDTDTNTNTAYGYSCRYDFWCFWWSNFFQALNISLSMTVSIMWLWGSDSNTSNIGIVEPRLYCLMIKRYKFALKWQV